MNWNAERIEQALRRMSSRDRFCVSGELRLLIITAVWDFLDKIRTPRSPVYTIDHWQRDGKGIFQQIACTGHGGVARAAYDAAVAANPNEWITLRSGIRLIRCSVEQARRLKELGLDEDASTES